MADPITAAIAAIGAEVGGTIGATMIMYAGEIAVVSAFAATLAVSGNQRRRAQARARAAYNASLKDRELMIRSGIAPRRVVYGRDKISGPIVYAESTGDKGQYLHLVITLAAHECDAIEEVWFNDIKLPNPDGAGMITSGEFSKGNSRSETETLTASGGGTVTLAHTADRVNIITRDISVTTGGEGGGSAWIVTDRVDGWAHTGGAATITGLPPGQEVRVIYEWTEGTPLVRIKKHLGAAGQVADADLVAESAGKWTAAHVGAGITYLYVRLEYDQEVFGQVGLPNISVVARGKKVRDPRTGLTAWSDNAALCVADWLGDNRFGLGSDSTEVPDSEIVAAANICDEIIALDVGGTATQRRYTYNGGFGADEPPRDVLADLLSGMAGESVWTQGRWLVRAGAYRGPALTITPDHLAGRGVSIVPKTTKGELFNAVRVTYRDPAQGWAEVSAPLVTNAFYEAKDGGKRIVRTMQLSGAMDHWRAQRLGKIELERARQAVTVQLQGNLRTYDLSPTDTATLQFSRYGWGAGKVFEVRDRTWATDGTLQYTLRETAPGVWAWNFGEATTVDLAPDTDLPNPYLPPPALLGLTLTSGNAALLRLSDGTILARALVEWLASTSAFVTQGGRIEVQWRADTDAEWQPAPPLPGDATSCFVGPLPDGKIVLIRVRAVNASGRSGPWATNDLTVVGKLAAPSNVTGLAYTIKPSQVVISWDPCPDADYQDTHLRYGATWETSLLLWGGSGREYQHPRPDNGTYTVWAVHHDTSGNTSATPASLVVTVDDSIDPSASGESVIVEWSTDGTGVGAGAWHSTFTPPADKWARWKIGTGGTFTAPFQVVGESGTGFDFIFKRSATQPATPTGDTPAGWADAPPAADGNGLWASTATKTTTGALVGAWSVPVQIDGGSVIVEWSTDGTGVGAGAWHGTFTPGDRWSRWKIGPTGTYTAPFMTIGESGTGFDFIFKRAASLPATPTGDTPAGWADAPPAADGNPLWASTASKTPEGVLVGVWSVPVRIEGPAGPTGPVGPLGPTGPEGPVGTAGASARRAYALYTGNPVVSGAAVTTSGPSSLPATTAWSPTSATSWSSLPPVPAAGQAMFQSDGIYSAVTNLTTWQVPYLSNFKVGSLDAITANMGTLTSGNINTTGYLSVGGTSTLTLNNPISFPLTGVSRSISIIGNSTGGADVGVVGLNSRVGGFGVYAYNSANSNALVAMTNSASTTTAAALVRSVNGIAVQAMGGTGGLVATIDGVGSAIAAASNGPGTIGGEFYTTTPAGEAITNIALQATAPAGATALKVNGLSRVSGQIQSTVATGTAPLSVTSTTVVANLNADLLDGQHASAFQTALGFTPVQQGTGAGQLANAVKIGWSAAGRLRLTIDSTDFADTWPHSISGMAASVAGGNSTSTAGGAITYVTNLPAGTAPQTARWIQINVNGILYWVAGALV